MKRKSVSVIIPCYNVSRYIGEVLASLACQTVLPDEIVCVDDGSCDDTAERIERFAAGNKLNIKLIRQENSGVSVARNKGIESSCGDMLLFLDADDKYANGFIKYASEFIAKGYDSVYCWFTHDESSLYAGDDPKYSEKDKLGAMADFMYNKHLCHTCAFAYSRDILEKNKIRFTEGAKYGEDWEFTTKYLDCCNKVMCVSECMMFYRIAENSAMRNIVYSHIDAIEAAVRTEQYLAEKGSAFLSDFCGYMRHRAVFSVAHTFARYSQKEYFARFIKAYDVKKSMKILSLHSSVSIKVKLAAISFLISPWLFYHITGKR